MQYVIGKEAAAHAKKIATQLGGIDFFDGSRHSDQNIRSNPFPNLIGQQAKTPSDKSREQGHRKVFQHFPIGLLAVSGIEGK